MLTVPIFNKVHRTTMFYIPRHFLSCFTATCQFCSNIQTSATSKFQTSTLWLNVPTMLRNILDHCMTQRESSTRDSCRLQNSNLTWVGPIFTPKFFAILVITVRACQFAKSTSTIMVFLHTIFQYFTLTQRYQVVPGGTGLFCSLFL